MTNLSKYKKCDVKDCRDTHHCKGVCRKHYYHLKTYGDPLAGEFKKSIKQCKRCEEPHWAKGYCVKHYNRHRYIQRELAKIEKNHP